MQDLAEQNTTKQKTLSVSELNRRVKSLLEIHLPLIWVEGEISNLSRPTSGHWYFSLKDETAQVRCAMFKGRNRLTRVSPKPGDKVIVRARVSLYEGRGDFQLIVEHMEAAGFGLLQKRYEELKSKLHAEGLFDDEPKQGLPYLPKHIGIITSPTGAAIQDVLSILERRFPAIPVTIIPSAVQGDDAPQQLIEALKRANNVNTFDVLLLCRGGGSIEDLWAFNNEALARAIYESPIPVVSAIGHEIDFTIADFVADARAPTPSAAAEILSPDWEELHAQFDAWSESLYNSIMLFLSRKKNTITQLHLRIKHPGETLQKWFQALDQLDIRLSNAAKAILTHKQQQITGLNQRIYANHPVSHIEGQRKLLSQLYLRMQNAMHNELKKKQLNLVKAAELLEMVSPLSTLKRGYAIVRDEGGSLVRSTAQLKEGQHVSISLEKGNAIAEIKSI